MACLVEAVEWSGAGTWGPRGLIGPIGKSHGNGRAAEELVARPIWFGNVGDVRQGREYV